MEVLYQRRRETLLALLPPHSVAVVSANVYKTRSNDTEFPYRQDSNFYYLTGFEEDNAVVVLKKGAEACSVHLFVQPKNEEMELWTGIRLGVEAARTRFRVDEVYSVEAFEEKMGELLKESTMLYLDLFSEHVRFDTLKKVAQQLLHDRTVNRSPRTFSDVTEPLTAMRLVKSEEEISLIRKAVAITAEAHHSVMRLAQPGMMEYELQANIEYVFKLSGAYSDAYTTIVAGGDNANTLHYITNGDPLGENELVLIDAGCEYEMYASDVTRTFPVSGKFTAPQRELYEMVLAVQEEVIAMIRPGVTKKGLQAFAEEELTRGMVRLGILEGDAVELVASKAHKKYFPHGIGHWMGLDVHDPCPYVDAEGEALPLQPGMVLTVEPGIYIRKDDTDVPEKYRGIGIRIEDDILVTKEGCENLSFAIAKSVEAIEEACS